MKLAGLIKVSVLVMMVALTACSHLSKNKNGAGMNGEGSQTYGLGGGDTFGSGRDVATLDAPRDQTYYFQYDSNMVEDHDIGPIKAQANYLVEHPSAKVRLEGNTDERGSREYNVALGLRRAQAVEQLMEAQGVAPDQIAVVSYGKERPVALGHDESAWELNRRVRLVYESK
ncbi:MAG TPA: peptidoglycan-associated lipoprotein Pal [Coxiellaceae bacterium]|nr:peptidoglycan-associated lipoprotein Pal [Coxiellaceae bacterium]